MKEEEKEKSRGGGWAGGGWARAERDS